MLVKNVVSVTEAELLEPVTGLPEVLLVLASNDVIELVLLALEIGIDTALLETVVSKLSEVDELNPVGKDCVAEDVVSLKLDEPTAEELAVDSDSDSVDELVDGKPIVPVGVEFDVDLIDSAELVIGLTAVELNDGETVGEVWSSELVEPRDVGVCVGDTSLRELVEEDSEEPGRIE
jgi:hypothetical protein